MSDKETELPIVQHLKEEHPEAFELFCQFVEKIRPLVINGRWSPPEVARILYDHYESSNVFSPAMRIIADHIWTWYGAELPLEFRISKEREQPSSICFDEIGQIDDSVFTERKD